MVQYAFTQMLNNAIDHSRGETVQIGVSIDAHSWKFHICDDGSGAFRNIRETFGLNQDLEAVGELSKGKRTTTPEAHTGEGIFFTSKIVDSFRISSNNLKLVLNSSLGARLKGFWQG